MVLILISLERVFNAFFTVWKGKSLQIQTGTLPTTNIFCTTVVFLVLRIRNGYFAIETSVFPFLFSPILMSYLPTKSSAAVYANAGVVLRVKVISVYCQLQRIVGMTEAIGYVNDIKRKDVFHDS